MDPLRALDEIHAVTRFVAERPHHHAGVVFIAFHQISHTVEVGLEPRGILGEGFRAVADAVRFDIGLADHVKPEFVTQFEERRIVRIVRGAHRVDVRPFHL